MNNPRPLRLDDVTRKCLHVSRKESRNFSEFHQVWLRSMPYRSETIMADFVPVSDERTEH